MSSDGQISFAASMNHANIILKPRNKAMEPVADRLAVPTQNCARFSIDNPPPALRGGDAPVPKTMD